MRGKFGFAVLVLFVCASSSSCKQEVPPVSEKIVSVEDDLSGRKTDGPTIIENPKEPTFKEIIPLIEKELRIPLPDAPPEAFFSNISSLTIDKSENLYVVDGKEHCIKVFDSSGRYVRTIGKVGQGIGEMRSFFQIFIINSNELVLHDLQGRIFQVFTFEGQFLRSMGPPSGFFPRFVKFYKDYRDKFYWERQVLDEETADAWIEIAMLNDKLEVSKLIEKILLPTGEGWEKRLKVPVLEGRPEGGVIVGHPWEYKFYVYDINGILKKEIRKDFKVIPYSKEERDNWENRLGRQLSDAPYPFKRFCVDEKGWMFVKTNQRTENREYRYFDIFNNDGKYIYKVPIADRDWILSGDIQANGDPFLVRGGKIYLVRNDPDGNIFISRSSIFWNQ